MVTCLAWKNIVYVQIFVGRTFSNYLIDEDFHDFIFMKPYSPWRFCEPCELPL